MQNIMVASEILSALGGFEVFSVKLLPSEPAPLGKPHQVEVKTRIPYSLSNLYRPTRVVTNGNHISIYIYPDSYGFTFFSVRTDVVNIGSLPLGSYSVQVYLRPLGGTKDINYFRNFSVAPELEMTIQGSIATFQWPAFATNYVLQAAPGLSSQTKWMAVTNTPATTNGNFVVTLPVPEREHYYRLAAQP